MLKHITWTFILSYIVFSLFSNFWMDGNTVNVDRWSALNNSIEALLHGEYPYTASTHLQGRSSNLPGLLLIGLPFYFLGNVGLLQTFSFLLIATFSFKFFAKSWMHLLVILLFTSAPAYHWELMVKSDLVSNFALIMLFLLWYQQKKT